MSYTAGLIRAVSNPIVAISIETGGTADVWPTLWRMYTDTLDRIFFFESATSPTLLWFNFDDFDLKKGAKEMALSLVNVKWEDRFGDVTKKFKPVPAGECYYSDC